MISKKSIFCITTLAFTISLLFFSSCKKGSDDSWAVKIDDDTISIEEFNNYYYTQNKLLLNIEKNEDVDKLAENPSDLRPEIQQMVVKTNYLEHIIAQKLIHKKAMNDETINKKELETLIKMSEMQIVAQYYLSKIFKDEINVTDEEVNQFYAKNQQLFRGVPMSDAVINRIKQQIFLQKSQSKSKEYIMNLLAESKVNKEGFKKYMKDQDKKNENDGAKEGDEVKEEKK